MKRFQSLLASLLLTFAIAAGAAARDGIIHTGSPAAQPTPTPSSVENEGPAGGDSAQGETTTFDLLFEAAFDCLNATLTLF
ncbi:MAG TPA: hypothetical protein VK421_21060 [Pyrinomonadaceae bacterium]|nr:hypothetical protein [Pyrinomonadaceae bacterium]